MLAVIGGYPAIGFAGSKAHPRLPVLRGTVVWPPHTAAADSLNLRDQNGRLITLASLRGHIAVVTFLYSRCRQVCPIIGRELAITQWALEPYSPLVVVIISVAPQSDTPANTRAFVHKVGLSGSWHWLLGSRSQLAPVWAKWGTYVKAKPVDILHTAAVYLIDQSGYVRVADQMPFRPDQLAESVRALLASNRRW